MSGSSVRAMGRWTLAALVINAVLGSSIFALPATVFRLVGEQAPWAWIAGALGNGVVMLCFAEVASRLPSPPPCGPRCRVADRFG